MATPAADQIAAARQGKFTAVFPRGADATAFAARLAGGGFYVTDVKQNRKGGRTVTFTAAAQAFGGDGIMAYWTSMCETVGYYGSTFGEPPWGSGRRTAYLNGRPGPASML